MIREYDIKQKMAEAVRKEIPVQDFVRWIMSNSWNMHQDSSKSAVDLASEIHLLLDERDNFLVDDIAFLNELSTLNKSLDIKVIDIKQADAPQIIYVFRPITSPSQAVPLASLEL